LDKKVPHQIKQKRAAEILRLPPGLLQNFADIGEEIDLICVKENKPLGHNPNLILY